MVTDWVVTVSVALSALAAWAALVFSIRNAYALRKDRRPRVEMVPRWNLPMDAPTASKGPGSPATAPSGQAFFQCDVTNVGTVGVKIRGVYVWIDEPPGKPISLTLLDDEQARRLDVGDSQMWSAGPFEYDLMRGVATWTHVLVLDSVRNYYKMRNTNWTP